MQRKAKLKIERVRGTGKQGKPAPCRCEISAWSDQERIEAPGEWIRSLSIAEGAGARD